MKVTARKINGGWGLFIGTKLVGQCEDKRVIIEVARDYLDRKVQIA